MEVPDYLRQINLELYKQEQSRIAARLDEAVRLAEEAFLAEFSKLVSHLPERISGAVDGKPKVFRGTAVTNLHDFFGRFKSLSVRSNEDLEEVIDQIDATTAAGKTRGLSGAARQARLSRETATNATLSSPLRSHCLKFSIVYRRGSSRLEDEDYGMLCNSNGLHSAWFSCP